MSIFSSVRDKAVSIFEHIKEAVKGIFSDAVEPAILNFLHVLETNGGSSLLALAIEVVKEAEAGTPFRELIDKLTNAAADAGFQVVEIAAKSALQVAQTHLQELANPASTEPSAAHAAPIDKPTAA